MKAASPFQYIFNCFLLTLPVMAWDGLFTDKLPSAYQPATFQNNIPVFLTYAENSSRICVFVLAVCMPLSIQTPLQKKGLVAYITGLLLYFASWLALMYCPGSSWSHSAAGFMAPAYTPFVWLMGIAMIGGDSYFNLRFYRLLFIGVSVLFVAFHNAHTWIVYSRIY